MERLTCLLQFQRSPCSKRTTLCEARAIKFCGGLPEGFATMLFHLKPSLRMQYVWHAFAACHNNIQCYGEYTSAACKRVAL